MPPASRSWVYSGYFPPKIHDTTEIRAIGSLPESFAMPAPQLIDLQ
jgi:hypothetical protein